MCRSGPVEGQLPYVGCHRTRSAVARRSAGGFEATGEEGFEPRFGFLAGDRGHVGLLETGFFEKTVEGAFLKTEPDVGIEFVGFFEGVLFQVQDENLPAGLENAVGFFHRGLGVLGVVKRLAEDGEVHGFVGKRDLFYVAELVGEIGEAVFGG